MFRRPAVAALVACALAALILAVISPKPSAADRYPGDVGMLVGDLSREVRHATGFRGHGVVVLQVFPGGPADREGLREGDIIFEFENHEVTTAAAMMGQIRSMFKGELASLKYWREGSTGWELLSVDELVPLPAPEELEAASREALDERFANLERGLDDHVANLERELDDHSANLERELDDLRARVAALEAAQAPPAAQQPDTTAVPDADTTTVLDEEGDDR